MRRSIAQLFGALAFAAPLFASAPAHAGIESCGNIQVSASAECKVEVSGGCVAECTPLSCNGQCSATASVDCTGSCQAECEGSCDPGSIDCNASCEADCSGNCDARCESNANRSQCTADCKGSCTASCDASCSGSPPSCQGSCEASCSGSCTAEANASCQIDCQGGCRVQCETPDGSLFCDGKYVDAGDNLQDCLDYLASIGVSVDLSARADCSGNTCSAEAEASVGCAAAPQSGAPIDGRAIALAALGLGLVAFRRRAS